jgi:hypothetical protein
VEGASKVIGTLRVKKSDEVKKREENWSPRIHKG